MVNTLRQIIRMKASLWVNGFCYYFKRLWLVGKWMPDSIYSQYKLKRTLSIVAVALRLLAEICGKPLYLLCFVALPLMMSYDFSPDSEERLFAAAAQILFFLSCVIGAFGDNQIFTVTRDKVTCIKYLHMNARTYLHGYLAFKYVPFFVSYLPWLLAAARLLGGTFLQGWFLWLMLLAFRMIGEALQLLLFDRTGKVLSRNMVYDWAVIIVGLSGAYLPAVFGWDWPLAAILLHPLCVAAYSALGAVCFWYITAGYGGYEKKFHRSIDLNFLLSRLLKSASGSSSAAFKEIEMKEKDTLVSDAAKEKIQGLKGYAYINALFFIRHRRQLVKPVYYRLIATGLLFAGAVVFWAVSPQEAVRLSRDMTAILPFFIYVMYFMTVADKASRAMFYNCDKDMLRYAYYRQPQTILKNFQIRLLRVSLYDLAIAGAVCLTAAGFCLLCGTGIFTVELLVFCTTILLLSVLFTAHHLCLYYIFQPYSESLQVKNPFYSAINMGMYVICFLCLKIKVGGVAFGLAALVFTILYIAGVLALVFYRAPKAFRIK